MVSSSRSSEMVSLREACRMGLKASSTIFRHRRLTRQSPRDTMEIVITAPRETNSGADPSPLRKRDSCLFLPSLVR